MRRAGLALSIGLVAVLAACSGAGEQGDSGGGEEAPATELVIANKTEPPTFDPADLCSYCGGMFNTYEFLVDYGPGSTELEPFLAAEVPASDNGLISKDGLTYTFPLREGVKFHDGTEMTAEDVEFSWDRAMTMDMPQGQAGDLSAVIDSMRVVDDYTFEVTLKHPAPYFLNSVVGASYAAAIVSKDAVEANGGVEAGEPNEWMATHTAGTGPYMLRQWDRDEQILFDKFDDYWGEPVALDARWETVVDDSTATLGLRGGDFDVIEPLPQLVAEVEDDPDVCITEEGDLIEPILAAFNLNIPEETMPKGDTIPSDFFADVRVRKAFNLAFDYDAYINTVMSGYASPANYIPPAIFGYDENAPRYTRDLDEAQRLMEEAGYWEDGFTVSVLVESNSPEFYRFGLLLKDNLAELNPKFNLNVMGVSAAVFDEAFVEKPYEYPMWIKNQDAFRDPYFIFRDHWDPDGLWGQAMDYRAGYANPDQIKDLIDQAAVEVDEDKRYELYGQLQRLVYEDPMWIYASQEQNIQIANCRVEGFSKNTLWPQFRPQYWSK